VTSSVVEKQENHLRILTRCQGRRSTNLSNVACLSSGHGMREPMYGSDVLQNRMQCVVSWLQFHRDTH